MNTLHEQTPSLSLQQCFLTPYFFLGGGLVTPIDTFITLVTPVVTCCFGGGAYREEVQYPLPL